MPPTAGHAGRKKVEGTEVYKAILDHIRSQGQEPNPATFYACLLTLLQQPRSDLHLGCLRFLRQIITEVNQALLARTVDNLLDANKKLLLASSSGNKPSPFHTEVLLCMQSLFDVLPATRAAIDTVQLMDPGRSNVQPAKEFATLNSAMLRSLAGDKERAASVFVAVFPGIFKRWVTDYYSTTPMEVSHHTTREMKRVFSTCARGEVLEAMMHDGSCSVELVRIADSLTEEGDEAAVRACEFQSEECSGLGEDSLLGRTLVAFHSLLSSRQYENYWSAIADVVSTLMHRIRPAMQSADVVFPQVPALLLTLDFRRRYLMQSMPGQRLNDNARLLTVNLEKSIGACIRALGCKKLMRILPIDIMSDDKRKEYLLPLLEKHISHDSIRFFLEYFVPIGQECESESQKKREMGANLNAEHHIRILEDIWALAPGFCTYPSDLAEEGVFPKLAKSMLQAATLSHKVNASICLALRLLVFKNKELAEALTEEEREAEMDMEDEGEANDASDDDDGASSMAASGASTGTSAVTKAPTFLSAPSATTNAGMTALGERGVVQNPDDVEQEMMERDIHAYHSISKEQARANVEVLQKWAGKLMPALCNLYEKTPEDRRGFVMSTLHEYAKIAPKDVLDTIFKKATTDLKKHIISLRSESASEMAEDKIAKIRSQQYIMCDVASSLCQSIAPEQIMEFASLFPSMVNDMSDPSLQKKSYRALERILYTRRSDMGDLAENCLKFLISAKDSTPVHCRGIRFKCFLSIIHIRSVDKTMLKEILEEVVLGVKDINYKARGAAVHLMAAIAAEQRVQDNDNAKPFFIRIAKFLDRDDQHTRACSIACLSELYWAYHEDIDLNTLRITLGKILAIADPDQRELGGGKVPPALHSVALGCIKRVTKVMGLATGTVALDLLANQDILRPLLRIVLVSNRTNGVRGQGIRANMRKIMEKCIHRLGIEAVRAAVDQGGQQYINYLEKDMGRLAKKAERAKQEKKEAMEKRGRGSHQQKGAKKAGKKSLKSILFQGEMDSDDEEEKGSRDPYQMHTDPSGKILITAEEAASSPDWDKAGTPGFTGASPEQEASQAAAPGSFEGKYAKLPDSHSLKLSARKGQKRKRIEEQSMMHQEDGSRFKAKRAKGDVTTAGGQEPHAYFPLSKSTQNKRGKKLARTQYSSLGMGKTGKRGSRV